MLHINNVSGMKLNWKSYCKWLIKHHKQSDKVHGPLVTYIYYHLLHGASLFTKVQFHIHCSGLVQSYTLFQPQPRSIVV